MRHSQLYSYLWRRNIKRARNLLDCEFPHHQVLRGQEQRVRRAFDRLGSEIEVLYGAGEPLEVCQERREVEGKHARQEEGSYEALPCLGQPGGERGKRIENEK